MVSKVDAAGYRALAEVARKSAAEYAADPDLCSAYEALAESFEKISRIRHRIEQSMRQHPEIWIRQPSGNHAEAEASDGELASAPSKPSET
ncbi:hypothetical protein [Roseomonas sp. BN140053]|uniref:hypothetical protein n=1 Tax=Roseomonas sp. BN140053 TaxID=3391898 RepID=UPI0039E85B1A